MTNNLKLFQAIDDFLAKTLTFASLQAKTGLAFFQLVKGLDRAERLRFLAQWINDLAGRCAADGNAINATVPDQEITEVLRGMDFHNFTYYQVLDTLKNENLEAELAFYNYGRWHEDSVDKWVRAHRAGPGNYGLVAVTFGDLLSVFDQGIDVQDGVEQQYFVYELEKLAGKDAVAKLTQIFQRVVEIDAKREIVEPGI